MMGKKIHVRPGSNSAIAVPNPAIAPSIPLVKYALLLAFIVSFLVLSLAAFALGVDGRAVKPAPGADGPGLLDAEVTFANARHLCL